LSELDYILKKQPELYSESRKELDLLPTFADMAKVGLKSPAGIRNVYLGVEVLSRDFFSLKSYYF